MQHRRRMQNHPLRMNRKYHEKEKRLQALPIGVVITFKGHAEEIIRLQKKLFHHSKYPLWIHDKDIWAARLIPDDYNVEE